MPSLLSGEAWVPVLMIVFLVILLYGKIALKLAHDWYTIPDYSHGMLIPFFAAYLVWEKRHILRRTPLAPTWAGLPVLVFALFLLLLGVFGADLFLSRISFLHLTAGLIWTLLGWDMLTRSKAVIASLLLAIPLPSLLLNHITFPLQLLASSVASAMLPLVGIPVLREGNIIQLPSLPLEVAEACSGIRSLMSLLTIALIYGYFMERTAARRTILALASIPIAVAANVVRIIGTGLLVQYWNPEKAMGFFHEFSGWLMFLVSLTCLYLVHLLMGHLSSRCRQP